MSSWGAEIILCSLSFICLPAFVVAVSYAISVIKDEEKLWQSIIICETSHQQTCFIFSSTQETTTKRLLSHILPLRNSDEDEEVLCDKTTTCDDPSKYRAANSSENHALVQLIISSILITRDERRQGGIHINHRESRRTKDVDIDFNVSEIQHRIEFRNPSLDLYQISRFNVKDL